VLIVALLFLVMLTLLGVTAMTGTTMEERMAGNARDNAVAFQAAEAALRDARRDLGEWAVPGFAGKRNLPTGWALDIANFGDGPVDGTCNPGGTPVLGLCIGNPRNHGENAQLPAVPPAINIFTAAPSVAYGQFTGATPLEGVSVQPHYLIELFCLQSTSEGIGAANPPCNFFRITAVGYGANPATTVKLQEIIVKEAA
jgi:type IV pilus assembly protein PilX